MHLEELMVMGLVFTFGQFRFLVPVQSGLSAQHDQPPFGHA